MTESAISVWHAKAKTDLAAHYAIRHHVFVNEQGVLVFTDVDRWDDQPGVVHVLAARGRHCAGSVRLYPLDDEGRWKGDRLAVLKNHRATVIGAQLVRFATATAAAAGGKVMEASIQIANVKFFRRLGWTCDGAERTYFGLLHQPMLFDLAQAPPLNWPGRPDALIYEDVTEHDEELLYPAA
ncbi:MSMEG_0567/Sll0786 family nitrogen starvation N-acetyltransferase [Hoeflea sp. TYP-13]|uniref:MSMEG_0567/Sll0786 family nitrogen starvation N-acetyltransferase n=1 Tax=Hoeflea sp. TYP-13 TaxID=3230023 RepID=UPI0034C5D2E7